MALRKAPRKFEGEVTDPFATPPTTRTNTTSTREPAEVFMDFGDWITTPSGVSAGNIDSLLEVMSQGSYVRSKLAFHKRLMIAFEAGKRAQ